MTDLPLLEMFAADELAPAETVHHIRRGDRVSFELADGSVIAIGEATAICEGGAVKVRVADIGSFLVPPGYVTIVDRAAPSAFRCSACGITEGEIYASGLLVCIDVAAGLCGRCDWRDLDG